MRTRGRHTQRNRARSLRSNFGAAVGGNLAYTLSQFAMLLAVVRITDQRTVGLYALALAVTAPVFLFSGLKLRQVQVTDSAGINRSGEFISVRLLTSAGALIVCWIASSFLSDDDHFRALMMSVSVFKVVEAQVDILYGIMQRQERLDLVARSMLVRGVLGAVLFAVVLLATTSVPSAVWSLAGLTAVFVVTDSWVVRSLGASPWPEFSGRRLGLLAWLAVPLGLSVAAGSLTTNVSRYFLEALEGTESVGIFATVSYVLVAVSLIAGSAAEAASPRLSNLYWSGDRAGFLRVTRLLALFGLAFGLTGTVAALALGRPVLGFIFGDEYAEHNAVLVVLMAASTLQFVALAVGAAVTAMRLFAVQVPIHFLGLIVATLSSWLLIHLTGLMGAALSIAVTQAVLAACYFVLMRRQLTARTHAAGGITPHLP